MWQQATAPGTYSWEEALSYAENLTYAGYDDWRLPNKGELLSIVDYSEYNPAINTTHFPNTISSIYLSSTTKAYNTDYARGVHFYDGDDDGCDKSDSYYARAVRGGQNQLLSHLLIYAPGQASTWDVGDSMTITWGTQGISGNVKISISRQGGKVGTFDTIAASTPNDGSYTWPVSGPESVNCMLKIEPLSDPGKGTVQGLFSIVD